MPEAPPSLTPTEIDLHGLIGHALLTGLCPLIPIPFVDDWVRDVARRRMVRQLLQGTPADDLDDERVKVLANGYNPTTASGCAGGCLRKIFKVPIDFVFKLLFKKVLRKILFFLALKDCVDTFSETFHEGFLLRHALGDAGCCEVHLTGPATFDQAVELRRHVEHVRDEVDHRPIEKTIRQMFSGSRRMMVQTAKLVGRRLRHIRRTDQLDDEHIQEELEREQQGLDDLVDRLTAEIGAKTGYLDDLRARLDQRLPKPGTVPSDPTPEGTEAAPDRSPTDGGSMS